MTQGRPGSEDDLLARERERVMYALSLMAIVFLVPLAINDLLKGRWPLSIALLTVVAAFAADGWAIRARKPPPVPYALLLVPIAATITLSLATQGVIGAFWCYPVVLFLYFVLSRPGAAVCSVALLLVASGMVYHYLTMRITVRFVVSLTLTIFMVDTIQSIIRQLQRRLLQQAITDPLTGAFNRRHMATRLEEARETSRRSGAPVSLLVIDIDHFKRINDEHGHEAGDTVLRGVVSIARGRARKVDLVFRMGGEEFVLLLPDTAEAAALAVAEDLRRTIEGAALLDGRPVTASIGVGGLQPADSVDSWLKGADAALYAAKDGGRNRVERRAP